MEYFDFVSSPPMPIIWTIFFIVFIVMFYRMWKYWHSQEYYDKRAEQLSNSLDIILKEIFDEGED